jgi:hypothetical protein
LAGMPDLKYVFMYPLFSLYSPLLLSPARPRLTRLLLLANICLLGVQANYWAKREMKKRRTVRVLRVDDQKGVEAENLKGKRVKVGELAEVKRVQGISNGEKEILVSI